MGQSKCRQHQRRCTETYDSMLSTNAINAKIMMWDVVTVPCCGTCWDWDRDPVRLENRRCCFSPHKLQHLSDKTTENVAVSSQGDITSNMYTASVDRTDWLPSTQQRRNSLEPMQVEVTTQDWTNVWTEPQRVEHRQQIEKCQVSRIGKPWLDWNSIICNIHHPLDTILARQTTWN